MSNSNTTATTNGLSYSSNCNTFNSDYCVYRLPCGTCMMLKSACPHIPNKASIPNIENPFKLDDFRFKAPSWETDIPDSCKNCPNHPANGGSGNCNCTLGDYKVTC